MVIFAGCVMEPPTTYYSFKIYNQSKYDMVINYTTIKDSNMRNNTIKVGSSFYEKFLMLQPYEDYGDNIIRKFFPQMNITVNDKQIGVDPLKVHFWQKNTDSLVGGKYKSGTCFYFFTFFNNANN